MENNTNANGKHLDIYEMVTREILRSLASGVIPWRQTWTARKGQKHPFTNYFNGKSYSFLNTLLLGAPGEFATFKQIKDAGGHILKGAKSFPVIYWGEFIPKDKKEEAARLEEEGKDTSHLKVKFPKYYRVFNINDAEGYKKKQEEDTPAMTAAEAPTDIADMVIDDYTVNENIVIDEDDACVPSWNPETDTVTIPSREAFTYEEDRYASLFEQLVYSTAKEGRCSRKQELKADAEGETTVKKSLIGEIGSSMILTVAGMKRKQTHEQIAAECQKLIAVLNNDYRLIVQASYGAERAAKLILGDFAA